MRIVWLICAVCWLTGGVCAHGAGAQEILRLPPVFPFEEEAAANSSSPYDAILANPPPQYRLASTPTSLDRPILTEEAQEVLEGELPPGARDGVFQKVVFTATWLPPASRGDLGVTDLSIYAVFGFPFPARETPLLLTPAFEAHLLEGPIAPDLPPRVYDAELEIRHLRKLTERWAMDVSVSPGMHSDFAIDDGQAFRIPGRGLGVYEWSQNAKVVLGVLYLDRSDVSILPVAGVIATPNDDWRYELVFPQPRIARRIYLAGPDDAVEHWAYVLAEFGGGVWAIRRASGARDVVTARDYRVSFGLERKKIGGIGGRFEVGYVFGRTIEYQSGTPDYEPGDTVMLRVGSSY